MWVSRCKGFRPKNKRCNERGQMVFKFTLLLNFEFSSYWDVSEKNLILQNFRHSRIIFSSGISSQDDKLIQSAYPIDNFNFNNALTITIDN